jgi:hypothetical protein
MASHINRNFVVAYVLLVGLPIVGLLAVLKTGRKLNAPISVDGVWRLEADAAKLSTLPCGKALAESKDAALAISQSGTNFTLTLANGPRSDGAGTLAGTSLNASLAPSSEWSAQGNCGAERKMTLVATVDPNATPRSLTGLLSASDCPACTAVEFRAVRQAPARRASQ